MKIYETAEGKLVACHSNNKVPEGATLFTGEAVQEEVLYYDGGFSIEFARKGETTWISEYLAENWWCEGGSSTIDVVDGDIVRA